MTRDKHHRLGVVAVRQRDAGIAGAAGRRRHARHDLDGDAAGLQVVLLLAAALVVFGLGLGLNRLRLRRLERKVSRRTAQLAETVEELKQAIRRVESTSEDYVARRMNASVQKMLSGKNINQVDM